MKRTLSVFALACALCAFTPHVRAAGPEPRGRPAPVDPHTGGGDPHAGGAGHAAHGENELEAPPEDTAEEDAKLPPGTLMGVVLDENEKPLPNMPITIGVVKNSVAKGESREHLIRTTDANGLLRIDNLERDSTTAYRITALREGATYAAPPFRLPEKAGVRFSLHVYPATKNLDESAVVMQAFTVVEIKDDRIQISQLYGVWNFGKSAWLANITIPFPKGFTAFTADQGMTDLGMDLVEGVGAHMRGTVAPGQHQLEFRWQLPYDEQTEIAIDAPLPPHLAAAKVIVPASLQMKVKVDGFDDPKIRTGNDGQRAYQTERTFRREEKPVDMVRVHLTDLPQTSVNKSVRIGLASVSLLSVAYGVGFLATRKRDDRSKAETEAQRARLLEELGDLEDAKERGDVGPKTYERERRELIDAIAATFSAVA